MKLAPHPFQIKAVLTFMLGAVVTAACGKPTPSAKIPTDSSNPASQTIHSSPTLSHETLPTPVEVSIQNPGPTPTPVEPFGGPLNADGPWMLYSLGPKQNEWYVVNPDGSGRALLAMENTGTAYVSPQAGTHLVAFKDSDQIAIYKLPELELVVTIPLLPHPEVQHPDTEDLARLHHSVRKGPPHWSPTGRYLAFVAAIEAPSADVYIFDTQANVVRRLSDDPDDTGRISWSPEGQWIVYETTKCVEEEPDVDPDICWDFEYIARAASISGKTRKLYEPDFGSSIIAWTTSQSFFSQAGTPNLAAHTIRHVDLGTGQVEVRFRGWWWSPTAYDPISDFLVVPHQPFVVPDELRTTGWSEGLYVLTTTSDQPRMVDTSPIGEDFSMLLIDENLIWSEFLGHVVLRGMSCKGDHNAIPSITIDGSIECLLTESAPPAEAVHWSPDGKWAVNTSGTPAILGENDEVIYQLQRGAAYDVLWRADSLGVFIITEDKLVYVSIPDGQMVVVDDRYPYAIPNYSRPLIWIGVE